MTTLSVHPADRSGPGRAVADIPATLAAAGVLLQRWPLRAGDPLVAYAPEIEALKTSYGFTAIDVVSVRPDTPGHAAMRTKFLAEHTHDDFEVRFFAAGSGTFYLHFADEVFILRCEAGDLISVPAGTRHWFDMGERPSFTAIRLFTRTDGWVATFTGDDLALHFPPHADAPASVRAVLCDIEGTTTDVRFVHDVLFPYAAARIPAWVAAHPGAPELAAVRDETGATTPAALTEALLGWMAEDRKATALKAIQGQLWAEGYADGTLHAHVYPDVAPAFVRWTDAGLRVAIYSSGSVQAQQVLFGATDAGDLRAHISGWFDTTTGPKRAAASYTAIATALELSPDEVLFLSDTPEELDAAALAGMRTCQLAREGTPATNAHAVASTFDGLPR